MYAYLNGILSEKIPDYVVVDCQGIGFELKIPLSTFAQLPNVLDLVKLFVYCHTNEEGTKLYGFYTKQEKELFILLINVNRIGPRSALAILSSISVSDFITCILTNDLKSLSKVHGIGKKSAERLVVELKDKVEEFYENYVPLSFSAGSPKASTGIPLSITNEVEAALLALGYKNYEIRKAIQCVKINENNNTEEFVKHCIKYIYLQRNES